MIPQRHFRNGTVYQSGLLANNLLFYDFYQSSGLDMKECLPPYNSNPECPPYISEDIPILKCKIGLEPQVCNTNQNKTNYFPGYK
jgi:hypothetical protein